MQFLHAITFFKMTFDLIQPKDIYQEMIIFLESSSCKFISRYQILDINKYNISKDGMAGQTMASFMSQLD